MYPKPLNCTSQSCLLNVFLWIFITIKNVRKRHLICLSHLNRIPPIRDAFNNKSTFFQFWRAKVKIKLEELVCGEVSLPSL